MNAENIYRVLSYETLSTEQRTRLAALHTEIGTVYREAGLHALEKIEALKAAWFRNDIGALTTAPRGTP